MQLLLNKFDYAYLAHASDVLSIHAETQQDNDELNQMIIDARVAFELESFQGGK